MTIRETSTIMFDMSNANNTASRIESTIRAAGADSSHPLTASGSGFAGDFAIHSGHATGSSAFGVLRALAMLGVSRGPWRCSPNGHQIATLSDLDGEERGAVVQTSNGASATLSYGLSRPLACFAI